MRPSKRWASRGWRAFAGTLVLGSAGCAPDFEKLSVTRGARGSLGEEVYKTVCRRVAGTEVPSDLDGRDSATLCLGAAEDVAAELEARRATLSPRLVSLAERRARIAAAVDAMLPGSLAGDLDDLLRQLIPFYDPPNDLLPQGSRMTAALMRRIAASDGASGGRARRGGGGLVAPGGAPPSYRSFLTAMRKPNSRRFARYWPWSWLRPLPRMPIKRNVARPWSARPGSRM